MYFQNKQRVHRQCFYVERRHIGYNMSPDGLDTVEAVTLTLLTDFYVNVLLFLTRTILCINYTAPLRIFNEIKTCVRVWCLYNEKYANYMKDRGQTCKK